MLEVETASFVIHDHYGAKLVGLPPRPVAVRRTQLLNSRRRRVPLNATAALNLARMILGRICHATKLASLGPCAWIATSSSLELSSLKAESMEMKSESLAEDADREATRAIPTSIPGFKVHSAWTLYDDFTSFNTLRCPNTLQLNLFPIDFQIRLDFLSFTVTYQDSYQRASQCRSNSAFHRSDPALTVTSTVLHLSTAMASS
ncbi:hypothetical protein TNCV_4639831 [Trichonephila clavipes]|nr:hypothetical protein TNCV_4639831 [Trichonephila clavipes]